MVPHILTLFEFLSIQYGNQHQLRYCNLMILIKGFVSSKVLLTIASSILHDVCIFSSLSLKDFSHTEFLLVSLYSEHQEPKLRTTKSGFDCAKRKDAFYPNPNSCSDYYQCIGGTTYHFNCAAGLHFDNNTNGCNWPKYVKCSTSASTETKTVPTTTYVTPPTTYPAEPIHLGGQSQPNVASPWDAGNPPQPQLPADPNWRQPPPNVKQNVPPKPAAVNDRPIVMQTPPPTMAPPAPIGNQIPGGSWGYAMLQEAALPAFWHSELLDNNLSFNFIN